MAAKPRGIAPLELAGDVLEGKFMGVDVPLEDARFLVWSLPYERTTSYKKGTVHGPAKFIEGSLGAELYDEELGVQTYKAGIHTLPAFRCDGEPEVLFPRIKKRALELARMKDKVLMSVGGEHSVSQPLLAAYQEVYPDLNILHFDAHADLRKEFEGTPYNHACALHPASRTTPTVQVGIRSIAEEEAHYVNDGFVTTYTWHDNRDLKKLIPKVLAGLKGPVYLTIDLDGFDPCVVPGVGTPQPGGYLWHEGLDIFRAAIKAKDVVAVDIMELCPLQDTVMSELTAAKLGYRLMGYLWAKERSRSRRA